MPAPIQKQDKGEMRRSIGINLSICIVGEATSTVDTSSLIDAINLRGGDGEHDEKQTMIFTPVGSIVAGEKSFVASYSGATSDATMAPVFSASITDGDKFEMWDTPWFIDDIDNVINQAIQEMSKDCMKEYQTLGNFISKGIYEYSWLDGFIAGNDFAGLYLVEYVSSLGVEYQLHSCDTVWDELVDTDVTATLETGFKKEGTGALKLVAADALAAGDIMATQDITSQDISLSNELEIWVYSTVALDAGDLQVLLDDTAQCASPLESLNIPATLVSKWTRHIIPLANAHLDSAIISIGIKQITDKGAFTLYVDDIKANNSSTKIFKELNPAYWSIVRDGTNKLKFSPTGLALMGTNTQVRLTGLQLPALLSDDTTDSDIDPQWIIDWCTGRILIGHAKSNRLSIDDKAEKAKYYLGLAEQKKTSIRSAIPNDFRLI